MILANYGVVSSSGASFDADALAFITAASITDNTQKMAINTLVTDLKAYNIWTKMKALYPFVGGSATSHKFNLKDPRDLDVAYRLVFNGGWTHSSTGAKPNGTTGYANTFLTPLYSQSLNSNGIGYYAGTINNATSGDPIDMGANNSGSQQSLIYTTASPALIGAVNGSSISGSITNRLGFFSVQKTSSTLTSTYRNSTLINSGNSGGSLPIAEIYLGTISVNAIPYSSGYVNTEFRFSYISDGLDSTDITNFYTAVQSFNILLARNV